MPFGLAERHGELTAYATTYDEHRPHEALGGRTPREVHSALLWRTKAKTRATRALAEESALRVPQRSDEEDRLERVARSLASKGHLPDIETRRAAGARQAVLLRTSPRWGSLDVRLHDTLWRPRTARNAVRKPLDPQEGKALPC